MTFATDILEWKSRHIKKGRNKAKKKKKENHITFVDPKII